MRRPLALLIPLAAVLSGTVDRGEPARADATTTVRVPAEVYERNRTSLKEVLTHVARDLKLRAEAWPSSSSGGARPAGGVSTTGPGATLVLVVDPTSSMRDEMQEMHDSLIDVAAEGPRGTEIGVLGAGAEWTPPSDVMTARGALVVLKAVPFDGPKNLLEAVREAAKALKPTIDRPRAIVLITKEGGDGEDDVEATRDVLKERGVAFYAVAREAAFERPWEYDFKPLNDPAMDITQRFHPMPHRKVKGDLFYGGDVAFGLVPYRWELKDFPLAQTEFHWTGAKAYPVPSGFGYWPLASLAWTSEGRCFVYNFRAPGARSKDQDKDVNLYDFGFLNLFAPDLRPRSEVVKALEADRRALAVVKIWEYLADDEVTVLLDHGTLERAGQSLSVRPMLQVQSVAGIDPFFEKAEQFFKAKEFAMARLKRVEQALIWWSDESGKERPLAHPNEAIYRRVEADFDLLGFQLLKVRFHWREVVAALADVPESDLDGHHRIHLEPIPLALGRTQIVKRIDLGDPRRDASFGDVFAAGKTIVERYHDTPWALMVDHGILASFRPRIEEIRPPPIAPPPPPPSAGDGNGDPERPKPPRPPAPAPPPAGERPGSGSGSPTTGGAK